MKSKAYVFVFDGVADWEPALALCEIRKSDKYEVLAARHSRRTVITMTDQNIITASGLGSVEFAREIFREPKTYSDADTQMWFEMFKNGVIPASMR
jgi:hypothetical protein